MSKATEVIGRWIEDLAEGRVKNVTPAEAEVVISVLRCVAGDIQVSEPPE